MFDSNSTKMHLEKQYLIGEAANSLTQKPSMLMQLKLVVAIA